MSAGELFAWNGRFGAASCPPTVPSALRQPPVHPTGSLTSQLCVWKVASSTAFSRSTAAGCAAEFPLSPPRGASDSRRQHRPPCVRHRLSPAGWVCPPWDLCVRQRPPALVTFTSLGFSLIPNPCLGRCTQLYPLRRWQPRMPRRVPFGAYPTGAAAGGQRGGAARNNTMTYFFGGDLARALGRAGAQTAFAPDRPARVLRANTPASAGVVVSEPPGRPAAQTARLRTGTAILNTRSLWYPAVTGSYR